MTGPDGSRRESVDYKTYLKSITRIPKTLTSNSDLDDFDEDDERQVAQEDWAEDCKRYGLKVTESLNKSQYFDAMYQLVNLWSEDCNLSFALFLEWVFDNIGVWDVEKDMNAVECVGDKFEELKDVARAEEDAKEEKAAVVIVAAEEARVAHVGQMKADERAAAIEAEDLRVKQVEYEKHLRETDKLGAERLDINNKLSLLDDEEAELQRKLASGELSPEEAAAARARLAAIGAERTALQAQFQENNYSKQAAELDKALRALDDEEVELMRKLASGELSAEEEAAIRKRLDEIATDREGLLEKKHKLVTARNTLRAERASQEFNVKLRAINGKLRDLEDEEADLMRRLASGELSPEEEAEVRARLAAIALERDALVAERNTVMHAKHEAQHAEELKKINEQTAELDLRLSRLDDEEAELMRRLASGELSPEEEAEVRAKLAAIAQERAAIKSQQQMAEFAAQQKQIDAAITALDDEEAELRRRLEAGELSPEEEAAVQKRLEGIGKERDALRMKQVEVYRQEEDALAEKLRSGALSEEEAKRAMNRISALLAFQQGGEGGTGNGDGVGDEEKELMRKLASGELSPEEATAARARLAELKSERESAAIAAAVANQREEEKEKLGAKLGEIDGVLAALDDEEAELRRRLEASELSPEEEAAVRKRLEEIGKERAGLVKERDAIVSLQYTMGASERAAEAAVEAEVAQQAVVARGVAMERDRRRQSKRKNAMEKRRKKMNATINLDPKQGFHEKDDDTHPRSGFTASGSPMLSQSCARAGGWSR